MPPGLGATLCILPRQGGVSSAQGALLRHTRNSYSPQELRSRSMYSSSPNECALVIAIAAPPWSAVALGHIAGGGRKLVKQSNGSLRWLARQSGS